MIKEAKNIKRILATFLILGGAILISSVQSVESSDVSGLPGISYPLPLKISTLIPARRHKSPNFVGRTDLKLYLSTEGTVDSIAWDLPEGDTMVFQPYRDSILSCKFTPARIDGRETAFALVCGLEVSSSSVRGGSRLLAPFDSSGQMEDYLLLLASGRSNDFSYPEIREFPEYFYTPGEDSTKRRLVGDFAIIDISLDENGNALDRALVFASRTTIGESALISSGWAKYAPAEIGGTGINSVARLIVRYFPELNYPIKKVEDDAGVRESGGIMEDAGLIWTVPGQKYFCNPVLRTKTELTLLAPRGLIEGDFPVSAFILIKKDGSSRVISVTGATSSAISKFAREQISNFEFYPACVFPAGMKSDSEITLLDTFARVSLVPADSSRYRFEFQFWQTDLQRSKR
ncbi:MAG: hypothetical protein IIB00_09470 [candidate division Zixibacteria bacterium]|nr:hypothetical protein [candidate division Zixibacteria bacterium]